MAEYIERGALLSDIESLYFKGKKTLREVISGQPAANVRENVPGAWIRHRLPIDSPIGNGFRCSICRHWHLNRDNFCPNCGADMRKAEA